jgi:hypothetical protein
MTIAVSMPIIVGMASSNIERRIQDNGRMRSRRNGQRITPPPGQCWRDDKLGRNGLGWLEAAPPSRDALSQPAAAVFHARRRSWQSRASASRASSSAQLSQMYAGQPPFTRLLNISRTASSAALQKSQCGVVYGAGLVKV